ncbi:MAG: hypothetical protein ABEJ99_02290 [Candidatus Nanohaloarchaea archaeon]
MIAGLVLTDNEEEDSALAFVSDDKVETFSIKDTQEIVEKIKEKGPEILAADIGLEQRGEDLTHQEEELKEKGYSFTPTHTETKNVKRLQAIKAVLDRDMEMPPNFIRFDPFITAEELAIDEENGFESYGIDTSDLSSAKEFDALLGAVTARFYEQNQFTELGVVIPGKVEE